MIGGRLLADLVGLVCFSSLNVIAEPTTAPTLETTTSSPIVVTDAPVTDPPVTVAPVVPATTTPPTTKATDTPTKKPTTKKPTAK
jgi:hypothetical protein